MVGNPRGSSAPDVELTIVGGPEWWAYQVGALRVHPRKHEADYPLQEDRRCAGGGSDDDNAPASGMIKAARQPIAVEGSPLCLSAKRRRGIESSRAACGEVTGDQNNHHEQQRGARKR